MLYSMQVCERILAYLKGYGKGEGINMHLREYLKERYANAVIKGIIRFPDGWIVFVEAD